MFHLHTPGVYWGPSQTCKMALFAKIVNGWKTLNIFAKSSILDVWLGSECASVLWQKIQLLIRIHVFAEYILYLLSGNSATTDCSRKRVTPVQMTSFTTASLYKYSNILLIGSSKGVSEWFKQTGIYLTSFWITRSWRRIIVNISLVTRFNNYKTKSLQLSKKINSMILFHHFWW